MKERTWCIICSFDIILKMIKTLEDREKLLAELLGQHNGLRKDLADIVLLATNVKSNSSAISDSLSKFQEDIKNHLDLEDNTFYPAVLDFFAEKGLNPKNIQEFIDSMKAIAVVVIGFFEKYSDKERIEVSADKFAGDFEIIKEKIEMRMSSEEEGVYLYLRF